MALFLLAEFGVNLYNDLVVEKREIFYSTEFSLGLRRFPFNILSLQQFIWGIRSIFFCIDLTFLNLTRDFYFLLIL